MRDRYGIQLRDGKDAMIKTRLGKRIRHYGLASLADYCDLLQNHGDPDEWSRVVDALTTNFTHFLREPDHFSWMVEHALPRGAKTEREALPGLERRLLFG